MAIYLMKSRLSIRYLSFAVSIVILPFSPMPKRLVKRKECQKPFLFRHSLRWTRRESNPCPRPKMLDFTIFFHRFILSDPNLTPQKSANIDHFHCFNLLFLDHMDILLISDIDIGMTHQFAYYLNWNASSKHCRSKCVS